MVVVTFDLPPPKLYNGQAGERHFFPKTMDYESQKICTLETKNNKNEVDYNS
jgi:hypothetical protein